ncbi:MAG TPA: sialate O-acetylesterase [Prolixibacteraceae bacterium]|nr:sialate O-acetylesterase [Prolixibacteraceae bacterium]
MAKKEALYLLAGQSNAVGQGDSLISLVCKPNTAFEFDASANDFIPLKDPAGKPWEQFQRAGNGSVAPAFARRMTELTGQKIFMVTAARGGASCSRKAEMADYGTWDISGNLFDLAIEKTRMAEKKADMPLSGIIWMQGESDANAILAGQMTKDDYQEALENLIHRFRKEFGAELPFYIVQTAFQQDKAPGGCQAVREVQTAIAQKTKGVYIAYGETGGFAERNWFKDNVHYNQEALNDIGTKTAEFIFKAAQNKEFTGVGRDWTDHLDLFSMVQPVPQANKFIDTGYYVWCGSVTKGDDGKFYMLYSRWPLTDGFESWPVTSEIAVAVSNHPGGPFKHLKVALPARGTQFWDGSATHNPTVTKHQGQYYLFYMGTSCTAPIKKHEGYTHNWWLYRNTQRIGVAVADRPNGEWKRLDKPVLSVSPDSTAFDALMVSNPAATFDDKGRVILLYKQVCKTSKINGGAVRFGVAFSDSPFGPFVKHDKPIFEVNDGGKDWMVAEDPFVWFQNGTYLAIVRDVVGKFTGDGGAWALMVSQNGTDWQPAKHPKVIGSTFYWEGGVAGASKLERPCLYLENGVPKFLYGATRADKAQTMSFNVAVPLNPVKNKE